VFLIADDVERAFAVHPLAEDGQAVEDLVDGLSAALLAEVSRLPLGARPFALLTRGELQRRLRQLLRYEFPQLMVLSREDIPPDYELQVTATISGP
jgi:flagellar biosynthesis component FlhA